ncbi:plasmid replication protein RepC [Neorhizobium sp. DT-125]|uniref:plasmid replication protein RepC n=1 Tax=Neorhizobium sp. DT-125 TaxID=3396163 RepID=UPI003F1A80D6
MDPNIGTTPFGRRSMSLALLATQMRVEQATLEAPVDKWKLFRSLCHAKDKLGVTDRALAVLNALLSFYPQNELDPSEALVVFPSNAQLSLRTHGMAEQTIRRHLTVLIAAGLLIRRDSPNGKRYVRRNRSGAIDAAYGFSLRPLAVRASEIDALAREVDAERSAFLRLKEKLSLLRRDISKLIQSALEERLQGDWEEMQVAFISMLRDFPRRPTRPQLEWALDKLSYIYANALKQLNILEKEKNVSGNAYQTERHIQNSQSDSHLESEPSFETGPDITDAYPSDVCEELVPKECASNPMLRRGTAKAAAGAAVRSFPLSLVLRACPTIAYYGPGGTVSNWRDLMSAAVVAHTTLDVSAAAYRDACEIMGPENAATVIACVLERGAHINSPGGYLRDLTRRSERGEFAIGPMLMALLRANGTLDRQAS